MMVCIACDALSGVKVAPSEEHLIQYERNRQSDKKSGDRLHRPESLNDSDDVALEKDRAEKEGV